MPARKLSRTLVKLLPDAMSGRVTRLSDPEMKSAMQQTVKRFASNREEALRFRQDIGVARPLVARQSNTVVKR